MHPALNLCCEYLKKPSGPKKNIGTNNILKLNLVDQSTFNAMMLKRNTASYN